MKVYPGYSYVLYLKEILSSQKNQRAKWSLVGLYGNTCVCGWDTHISEE